MDHYDNSHELVNKYSNYGFYCIFIYILYSFYNIVYLFGNISPLYFYNQLIICYELFYD